MNAKKVLMSLLAATTLLSINCLASAYFVDHSIMKKLHPDWCEMDSYYQIESKAFSGQWCDERCSKLYGAPLSEHHIYGRKIFATHRSDFASAGGSGNFSYEGIICGYKVFNHSNPNDPKEYVNFYISGAHDTNNWDSMTIRSSDGFVNYFHKEIVHKSVTVGGIAIGTPISKLVSIYGEPTRKGGYNNNMWYYDADNWYFEIQDGLVYRIYLPKGSTRILDDYGIGSNNSRQEIETKFNKSLAAGRFELYDGTYLWYDNDGIQLNTLSY